MKDVLQHEPRLLRGGILQIDPKKQARVRQHRRHHERLDVLLMQGTLIGVGEGADHLAGAESSQPPIPEQATVERHTAKCQTSGNSCMHTVTFVSRR